MTTSSKSSDKHKSKDAAKSKDKDTSKTKDTASPAKVQLAKRNSKEISQEELDGSGGDVPKESPKPIILDEKVSANKGKYKKEIALLTILVLFTSLFSFTWRGVIVPCYFLFIYLFFLFCFWDWQTIILLLFSQSKSALWHSWDSVICPMYDQLDDGYSCSFTQWAKETRTLINFFFANSIINLFISERTPIITLI